MTVTKAADEQGLTTTRPALSTDPTQR